MYRYIIKKSVYLIITLVLTSIFTFILINSIPGDPAEVLARHIFLNYQQAAPPELVAEVSDRYNLDSSLLEQYFNWFCGVIHGDLGHSILYNRSVSDLIGQSIVPTIQLTVTSMVFAVIVGVFLGVYSAIRQNTVIDYVIRILTVLFASIPRFIVAIILILIFSMMIGFTPISEYSGIKSFILPSIVLGLPTLASIAQIMRTSTIETLEKQYVTFAICKGIPIHRVILCHVCKNAFIPVLTIIGMSFGGLLGGSVVIETIFSWPGIGSLLLNAIQARDVVLIHNIIIVIVGMFMIVNFVVDILYTKLNPRITYD
ncbi:MAG TPA: ABC transporter permease [Methanocorpusculum sp.]|nr:ABC transporter permease [Methanocorpusculum sp.]